MGDTPISPGPSAEGHLTPVIARLDRAIQKGHIAICPYIIRNDVGINPLVPPNLGEVKRIGDTPKTPSGETLLHLSFCKIIL
jgi:hypothetical protein